MRVIIYRIIPEDALSSYLHEFSQIFTNWRCAESCASCRAKPRHPMNPLAAIPKRSLCLTSISPRPTLTPLLSASGRAGISALLLICANLRKTVKSVVPFVSWCLGGKHIDSPSLSPRAKRSAVEGSIETSPGHLLSGSLVDDPGCPWPFSLCASLYPAYNYGRIKKVL
jgi:hypothetical protein